MTSKTLVLYYSRKGNTKALVNLYKGIADIDLVSNIRNYNLDEYSTIVFATSTYGRGTPPQDFFDIRDILTKIKGKRIGLFGSGNTHYEYFCGALDLLEEMLYNNDIVFKLKYEGYPKDSDFETMNNLIKKHIKDDENESN